MPICPELSDARRCLKAQKYRESLNAALPYCESNDRHFRREANRIAGLARFQMGLFPEAFASLKIAAEDSQYAGDWLNVALSATMAGEIALGSRAFAIAIRSWETPGSSNSPGIGFMRQWYACALRDRQEFGLAFEQISVLRFMYEQFRVTDPTFLHMRGMPFLQDTTRVAVDVLKALGPSIDALGWINDFAAKLDVEGQRCLDNARLQLRCDT